MLYGRHTGITRQKLSPQAELATVSDGWRALADAAPGHPSETVLWGAVRNRSRRVEGAGDQPG
jgi:hypothetical protein